MGEPLGVMVVVEQWMEVLAGLPFGNQDYCIFYARHYCTKDIFAAYLSVLLLCVISTWSLVAWLLVFHCSLYSTNAFLVVVDRFEISRGASSRSRPSFSNQRSTIHFTRTNTSKNASLFLHCSGLLRVFLVSGIGTSVSFLFLFSFWSASVQSFLSLMACRELYMSSWGQV